MFLPLLVCPGLSQNIRIIEVAVVTNNNIDINALSFVQQLKQIYLIYPHISSSTFKLVVVQFYPWFKFYFPLF